MKQLPTRPNLDYLYREAKAIKSRHRRADKSVCPVIGHFDTSLHGFSCEQIFSTPFSILDAQRVVARQYSFSSWRRLKCFVELTREGENPSDPALARMVSSHKKTLMAAQEATKNREGDTKKRYLDYRKLASESADILRPAYDLYGWPGPEVIGKEAFDDLINLAGNAWQDPDFQKQTLSVMSDALPEGKAYGYWYAAFTDRYLTLSNKPSIYGISFGDYIDENGDYQLLKNEVIDPENLEKRRARVGHDSCAVDLVDSARRQKELQWSVGTIEEAIARQNKYALEGGYV